MGDDKKEGGKAIAHMHKRRGAGQTYSKVGNEFGVSASTAHRRINPPKQGNKMKKDQATPVDKADSKAAPAPSAFSKKLTEVDTDRGKFSFKSNRKGD